MGAPLVRATMANGADDDQVALFGDPFAARQVLEEGFVEAAGGPVIDVFDSCVGVAKPSLPEPICEAAVVAFGLLSVEQKRQPFGVCQFAGLGVIAEFGEGSGQEHPDCSTGQVCAARAGVRSHSAKRSLAGLLIAKSARRRGEIAMQSG